MPTKKTPAKKTPAKTPVKKTPVKTTTKKTTAKAATPKKSRARVEKTSAPPPTVPSVVAEIRKVFGDTSNAIAFLRVVMPNVAELTPLQRRRLFGVQARKLGFIIKAMEIMNARPNFTPPEFSMPDMTRLQANLEEIRQLLALIDNFRRFLDDSLLTGNDTLYRNALLIYGQLQTLARGRVPGAQDLFNILRKFFTLRRRPGETEPTEAELEREFHSILQKHADGEIMIKNESPHLVGGTHEVVADVRKRGKRGAEIKVKE